MKKIIVLVLILICVHTLVGCASKSKETETEEKWDLIPMVMIDDTLYLDTGHESKLEGRYEKMDGEITSEVDGSEKPSMNDQSNFGTGYGYQYGATEGTVEIYVNEKWYIFAKEEVREDH